MSLSLEWKLSNGPLADVGFAIANTIAEVANKQVADLAEFFPFKGNWELQGHIDDEWLIVRITERFGTGIPAIGELKSDELDYANQKVLPFEPKPYLEQFNLLGPDWYSFQRFTYVGPYKESFACWPDLHEHLIDWLNHMILPEILRRNEIRILRAIPKPPQFDLEIIQSACWVLESEESLTQGTAFYLEGTGLITCQHVLSPHTVAFQPNRISEKFPVTVVAQNAVIDIAILSIDQKLTHGLIAGSADNLKFMDHVAVAGFPNYRYGDTGVIIPGLVVGFRMISGVRRILTNAPIVAGNSGGPVISSNNNVIGIAVTGAELMGKAQETENHGIIPIDALNLINKTG